MARIDAAIYPLLAQGVENGRAAFAIPEPRLGRMLCNYCAIEADKA